MKVSIWQQFSSNHSAHFTVVGRFSTETDASQAAEKFREILRTIAEWQSVPENRAWIELQQRPPGENVYYPGYPPTPPEIEYAHQYDVEWGYAGIDWVGDDPDERVNQIERDVFVSVDFETWNSPTPIKNLMETFGGDVKIQQQDNITLNVHLVCNLADEVAAQRLAQEAEPPLTTPIGKRTPWKRKEDYEPISASGKIRHEGKQIIIDCEFFYLDPGLPAMVEWLQKNGATDLEYTFSLGQEQAD